MTWRDRVLQKHAGDLQGWWATVVAEQPPTEDEFESEARANYLEAVRRHDRHAHLAEELHVRLVGDAANGALDFELGQSLLKPLQAGLSAAAEADVRMELVGIQPGSTVLVARPQEAPPVDDSGMAAADTSVADKGAREWLRILSTAEAEGDLRPWPRAFAPLGQLVNVLAEHELAVSLMWFALSGQRRRATLTQRGQRYVQRLRQTDTVGDQILVGGMVTELRYSGHVKLKAGAHRGATTYDVRFLDAEQLVGLHLQLGASVWFVVERTVTHDQIGNILDTRYTFSRLAAQDEQIPPPPTAP